MQPLPSLARAVSSPPTNRRPPEAQPAADAGPPPGSVPTSQQTQEAPLTRHEARACAPPPRDPPLKSYSQTREPFETQQPYISETSVGDSCKFWKRPVTPSRAEASEASDSSDSNDDVFLSSPSRRRRLHQPPLANFLKSPQGTFETPRSK